jgi:hypothetical protein
MWCQLRISPSDGYSGCLGCKLRPTRKNGGIYVQSIVRRRAGGRPARRAAPLLTPTAAEQTTQPAAPEKKQAKVKKPPTPGQLAARERLKKCGAEWKEAKAAGKIEKGMKWPKYWSACNKRLKAAG